MGPILRYSVDAVLAPAIFTRFSSDTPYLAVWVKIGVGGFVVTCTTQLLLGRRYIFRISATFRMIYLPFNDAAQKCYKDGGILCIPF